MTAAKAVFLAVIVAVLVRNDFISLDAIETAVERWHWVVAGWAAMSGTTAVSIIRWHYLVRAQGIPIPFRRSVQAAFVGLFFSTFLPGLLSGDVVKGYYVVRTVPGRATSTISSILFDRVVGTSGLIALASIALLLGGGAWKGMIGDSIAFAVVGLALGSTVFFAALLGIRETRDPILAILRRVRVRFRLATGPLRLYESLRVYHDARRTTLLCIVASVLAHGLLVLGWICYVQALDLHAIPVQALFVLVPIGMLVAALPIAPAGIGTGHAAFLAIFALLGSDRGADLYNVALTYQLLQGAIGGLVYLFIRTEAPISDEGLSALRVDDPRSSEGPGGVSRDG